MARLGRDRDAVGARDGTEFTDLFSRVGIEHLNFFFMRHLKPACDGIDAEIVVTGCVAANRKPRANFILSLRN